MSAPHSTQTPASQHTASPATSSSSHSGSCPAIVTDRIALAAASASSPSASAPSGSSHGGDATAEGLRNRGPAKSRAGEIEGRDLAPRSIPRAKEATEGPFPAMRRPRRVHPRNEAATEGPFPAMRRPRRVHPRNEAATEVPSPARRRPRRSTAALRRPRKCLHSCELAVLRYSGTSAPRSPEEECLRMRTGATATARNERKGSNTRRAMCAGALWSGIAQVVFGGRGGESPMLRSSRRRAPDSVRRLRASARVPEARCRRRRPR